MTCVYDAGAAIKNERAGEQMLMISAARKAIDGCWCKRIAIQPLCVMSDAAAGPTAALRVPDADERARCAASTLDMKIVRQTSAEMIYGQL